MDLSKTKIDSDAEREGVWVDFDDETSFRIARWFNPDHKAYIQRALKPYLRKHRRGNLPDDIANNIDIQAMAETILLGWKGLKNNGKEVRYSKGQALKLLQDPAQSWLVTWVTEEAQYMANYQAQMLEEGAENVGES